VPADVVEGADVRAVEARDGVRLALEAGADLGRRGELRRQYLDRHLPPQTGVEGAVDLAHAARAERCEDLVRTEPRSRSHVSGFRRLECSTESWGDSPAGSCRSCRTRARRERTKRAGAEDPRRCATQEEEGCVRSPSPCRLLQVTA